MKVIDFKDNKLIISPEALALNFFNDLWIRDKTSAKTKAYKDISYIYFMYNFESPYISYPEEERASLIKEYVVGRDFKVDPKIEVAIAKYKELTYTASMELLDAAYTALHRNKEYLKSVDYTKMDENGRFLYDPDKVQKMITNMPKLMEALNQAKEICLKETSGGTRNRGDYKAGLFEDNN